MIISRNALLEMNDEKLLFDYVGCKYPNGFSAKNTIYFNEENIDQIVFEGFSDDDEIRMNQVFDDWKVENQNNFIKGSVQTKT